MAQKRVTAGLVLVGLLLAAQLHAQAGLLIPTSKGRPDASVLSLREMAIDVGIARGYARVNIRQVFENHTGEIQEGTYRFRLPPSASVGDFAVWDGLVRIPGVILEKQRARAIYRELTNRRIDPGLLQQGGEEDREPGSPRGPGAAPSGGALFSVTVAPIPPRSTKRLELQFQQEVPFVLSQAEFRLGLRPPDGEPPTAGSLDIRVHLGDGTLTPADRGLILRPEGSDFVLKGTQVRLDHDLVVRIAPASSAPLRLTAFRNPEGRLPDGVALAPWERPSEIPPEKDGFFLLEMLSPGAAPSPTPARGPRPGRPPLCLGIVFDASISHRFSGLETSYGYLLRVLQALGPEDRFMLTTFDERPETAEPALRQATPEAVQTALAGLRARPLRPGSDVPQALAFTRRLVGEGARLLLLTDGPPQQSSASLTAARGTLPLFTALTGEESPEAFHAASQELLTPGSTEIEVEAFLRRVVEPLAGKALPKATSGGMPFTVSGPDPRLRDVYPVLMQPPAPGSLSGFIGRYAAPQERIGFEMNSALMRADQRRIEASLPDHATEARDLPRRWARARVDDLLMKIEAEGEKREWVDEIIALSKRYKFVTPYTAFLAAPRSLLRPRRIQPGDPVLRVECDPSTVSATALLPFGLRLPLVRRPKSRLWEGRFLVPEGLRDGRYPVRILLSDSSGGRVTESKYFILDGTAPTIRPDPLPPARAGGTVRVSVRTDEDVVLLSARLEEGIPVPLRWDPVSKRSVGAIPVPVTASGRRELFFEAVDAAKNHGFARATVEVIP